MKVFLILLLSFSIAKAQKLDTSYKAPTRKENVIVVRSKIDSANTLCVKGDISYEMSLYEEGLSQFISANRIDENNIYILRSIGFGFLKLRKLDSSIFYLNKALQLYKDDKGSLHHLIYCYLYKLDYNKSEHLAESYRAKYPDEGESYYTLLLINRKLLRYEKAIKYAKKAIDLYTREKNNFLGDAYYMLGILYYENKQHEIAKDYFKKAKDFGGVYVDPKYLI
ncbi:tetratricopeptide repeat protein [Pedobacter miscanthi]|uniref:Uncharacterized protein n=1 Tax=Pedobacter miscanthi TaxID=2259170 RepID=A0A366L2X7_9SPHI|nr:tetratricopeptide repeat protein [Pedobacter miscanthi]RBQ07843.1 hypothetical protein DRW42_09570 [Pedobacter miscanthi]